MPARGWRVAGRVSEDGSVFVCGTRKVEWRAIRGPHTRTQVGTRWSLPLPLTGTLADTAEAPLGTLAAREEMQRQ